MYIIFNSGNLNDYLIKMFYKLLTIRLLELTEMLYKHFKMAIIKKSEFR